MSSVATTNPEDPIHAVYAGINLATFIKGAINLLSLAGLTIINLKFDPQGLHVKELATPKGGQTILFTGDLGGLQLTYEYNMPVDYYYMPVKTNALEEEIKCGKSDGLELIITPEAYEQLKLCIKSAKIGQEGGNLHTISMVRTGEYRDYRVPVYPEGHLAQVKVEQFVSYMKRLQTSKNKNVKLIISSDKIELVSDKTIEGTGSFYEFGRMNRKNRVAQPVEFALEPATIKLLYNTGNLADKGDNLAIFWSPAQPLMFEYNWANCGSFRIFVYPPQQVSA